jgi:hypothetical protein
MVIKLSDGFRSIKRDLNHVNRRWLALCISHLVNVEFSPENITDRSLVTTGVKY